MPGGSGQVQGRYLTLRSVGAGHTWAHRHFECANLVCTDLVDTAG